MKKDWHFLSCRQWAYGYDLDCSLDENALMILMQSAFYKEMQGVENITATDIHSNVTKLWALIVSVLQGIMNNTIYT